MASVQRSADSCQSEAAIAPRGPTPTAASAGRPRGELRRALRADCCPLTADKVMLVRSSWLRRGLGSLALLGLLLAAAASAQRRPLLLRPRRDYFAGRIVLVPADGRTHSFQLPRQLARIADHELILPPFGLFGGAPEGIIAWARGVDYAEADGVILALDLFEGRPAAARELIGAIRGRRPGLPVFGFTAAAAPPFARELAASGEIDYLPGDPGSEAAAATLLARQLARRFGWAPQFMPIYPTESGRAAVGPAVSAGIKLLDGVEIGSTSGTAAAAAQADVLLFVHTPQTGELEREALAEAIAQAAAKGYRVALADVSAVGVEPLLEGLRRRKLLDQLAAYAAGGGNAGAATGGNSAATTIALALAQAAVRTVSLKFLRDDVERAQRAERAQVEYLLTRYLTDWGYQARVRPKLEAAAREQWQADPANLGASVERAEELATAEVRALAEGLFDEQFRRNVHTILMSTGERALFEVRLLQRLHLRLSRASLGEAEIRPSVYLTFTGTAVPKAVPERTTWELANPSGLDERLVRRFDEIDWGGLAAGTSAVGLSISVGRPAASGAGAMGGEEGYTIRSRAAGKEGRRIEISAPTPRGAFYALSRLEQLGAEGRLGQELQLGEAPAFARRGVVEGSSGAPWSHQDRLDMLRFMGRVRMNRYYYAPKGDPLHRERWRDAYAGADLARFKELVRVAQENFVEPVYALSPGLSISYASDADFAALARKLDALAGLGVRSFALLFDDTPAELARPEDRARFRTLAAAQAHLIRRLYEHLRRMSPPAELTVAPAVDTGPDGGREYLRELGAAAPPEVGFFWAGADAFAPEETEARAREWAGLIGRRPLVWDNFPANDAEPWRPYLGPRRWASPRLPAEAGGLVANAMAEAHASMLSLATTAAYAWDPRGYDPEQALAGALNLLYDERSRAGLRVWARTYGDYRRDQNLFEPLFRQQRGEVDLGAMLGRLRELNSALTAIGSTRERGLLRGELARFVARTLSAIGQLANDPAYEKAGEGKFRLREAPQGRH